MRFILGHLTQATIEDILHGQNTIESNPKNETLTSFRAQHNLYEAPYREQDKNSRFKKSFFVKGFGSNSLNFLLNWRAKNIGKD